MNVTIDKRRLPRFNGPKEAKYPGVTTPIYIGQLSCTVDDIQSFAIIYDAWITFDASGTPMFDLVSGVRSYWSFLYSNSFDIRIAYVLLDCAWQICNKCPCGCMTRKSMGRRE